MDILRKAEVFLKLKELNTNIRYDRKEVSKYMQIIGSHNSKHIERFRSYKSSKV